MIKAMTLGEYLQAQGLTQAELARRLNVDPNTVNRWLGGSRRPGWKTMLRLVELTAGSVTADSFLSHQRRAA